MSESHNNEATEGNETMKKATTFHKGDKVLYGQHVYHSVECNDFWGAGWGHGSHFGSGARLQDTKTTARANHLMGRTLPHSHGVVH